MAAILMMTITRPRVLYVKGALFVLGGVLESSLLVLECPRPKAALLLGVAVWCFARAYYFAFYVVEHYVDPRYRFDGLISFARYLIRRRRRTAEGDRT